MVDFFFQHFQYSTLQIFHSTLFLHAWFLNKSQSIVILLLILYRYIFPLPSLKIFFCICFFFNFNMICLGIVWCCHCHCYLSWLVFSEFPGSLVLCLLLILNTIDDYYFKYFFNSVLSFVSSGISSIHISQILKSFRDLRCSVLCFCFCFLILLLHFSWEVSVDFQAY